MKLTTNIHIVASNINTGGALVLLTYLTASFEKVTRNCTLTKYVSFDADNTSSVKNIRIIGIINKLKILFYRIDNTLYFGNLPPLVKSTNSIVYIHNLNIMGGYTTVWKSGDLDIKTKLKYSFLITYIKMTIRNVQYVMCQTLTGKKLLEKNFNNKNILVCPIYDDSYRPVQRAKEYDLCYVGLPSFHKNHQRLFQALDNIGKENVKITIAVTIPDFEQKLLNLINTINKNIEVVNFGMVPHRKVYEIYEKSRMLIFPSLIESFGLPLIEAARCNLPVITSDLGYVYDVIIPTDTFDPHSITSIEDCIKRNINKSDIQKAKLLVDNKIDMIFDILTKGCKKRADNEK